MESFLARWRKIVKSKRFIGMERSLGFVNSLVDSNDEDDDIHEPETEAVTRGVL